MPTANRRRFVPDAIRLFLAQDHAEKELIILDDGEDPIANLIPADPQVRYIREERRQSVGAKRNHACELAHGEIIAHLDDDDWYAPWRLSYQLRELSEGHADVNGLDRVLFVEEGRGCAWEYVHPQLGIQWLYGATLCYRKAFWKRNPFPDISIGEDTRFVFAAGSARVLALERYDFYVGRIHAANTSPKQTRDARWRAQQVRQVQSIMQGESSLVPPQAVATSDGGTPKPPYACTSDKARSKRVCIGVSVHSEPERLVETLAHLEANSLPGFEILLLADGPDSATCAALARLSQHRQSATAESRGAAACFNRLLRESAAEVLILLESGSLVGPGWLDLILAALGAHPRNGLAGPTTNTAWSLQGAFRGQNASAANVSELAAKARAEFGTAWRTLEPLFCLADFCYAIRRSVADAIGAADEEYGLGPCWEMDYTVRAIRSGFQAVWAQGAYVFRYPFSLRRRRDEARLLEASKRRYQDKFCGLKLNGARAGYAEHCRGDACQHFAPADSIQRVIPPGPVAALAGPSRPATEPPSPPTSVGHPLVSCIMPTHDRLGWVLQAIRYFDRQEYPRRELIIVDDSDGDLSPWVPRDARIRYVRPGIRLSIGEKRNLACELASGAIIVHWDDDDWYGPNRLSVQLAPLLAGSAEITALRDTIFFDLDQWQFWKCYPEIYTRLFVHGVHGGTLAFRREVFGATTRYPNRSLAEDAMFLLAALRSGAQLQSIPCEGLFAYVRHRGNSWRFSCGKEFGANAWWQCEEPGSFSADRDFYLHMRNATRTHVVWRHDQLVTASLHPQGL
jgi:glycosyltransferase involved in cell wall biosynthesis